ncbi:phage protein NinX family protein [Serratia aquatilis]|uniref:Phage protein NinX family protein n=1 Tax=Serratia aquatilis TaxID=1737515 RepID=A0ABV6E9E1_9GAMM
MIKWYEESDAEVNRSIALITGEDPDKWYPYGGVKGKDYCKNPSDAWPIICANKISLNAVTQTEDAHWQARITTQQGDWQAGSHSPLRAAMICFLLSQQAQ